MKFLYLLAASIILHALLMQVVIPEPECKKAQQKTVKAKIKQDKNSGSSKKLNKLYVLQDAKKLQKKQEKTGIKSISKDCKKYYTGIGIVHNGFFNEISQVASGGPADRAGIKVGDVLAEPTHRIRNQYSEGTVINVPIIRNGITINMRVTIGKICYDK